MALQPIRGHFSPAGGSRRLPAVMEVDGAGFARIRAEHSGELLASARAQVLSISSRIGNSARFIRLPDESGLETQDNDAVDQLVREYQPGLWRGMVHKLESHLPFVVLTAVIVFGSLWLGVVYGVPWISEKLAYRLPPDILNTVSEESMGVLDKTHFQPSTLSEAKREQLRETFAPMLERYADLPLHVIFRDGGEHIGANAFALPDGTLVFTDQMVQLAQSDDELRAVLAHEIGHVERRHSLRAAIQNGLLGVGYIMLVGDASAVSDVIVALPMVAATLAYSRDHEREADAFAARLLDEQGIDRQAFISLMRRLGQSKRCDQLLEDAERDTSDLSMSQRLEVCQQLEQKADKDDDTKGEWVTYLSTHPALEERLETFGRSE